MACYLRYEIQKVETFIESQFQSFRQVKTNFDIPKGKP